MNVRQLVPVGVRAQALAELECLGHGQMVAPACRQRLTTVVDESGQIYAIATTEKASQPGDVNRA